jgi:glyceraldehyde-3-phosphate dehydrogenase/erythrose-4-phosphate dehydrogenase
MTKVGINGFGRSGWLVFHALCNEGLPGKEIYVFPLTDVVGADSTLRTIPIAA